MGFKNDFSQAQQNSNLKPEGDYEVLIVKAEERQTKNGKLGLNFSMVIRNDVDQAYKNGYIFHTLWKRREPTAADRQVNGYSFGQVMALGKAAQLPDGKDYPDVRHIDKKQASTDAYASPAATYANQAQPSYAVPLLDDDIPF